MLKSRLPNSDLYPTCVVRANALTHVFRMLFLKVSEKVENPKIK